MEDEPLLLDTCAVIYLAFKRDIKEEARVALNLAAWDERLHVSAITAWEIGKVVSRNRIRTSAEPIELFMNFMEKSSAALSQLTPKILIDSSFLPGPLHKDPMDRIIIATARQNNFTLVTDDRSILQYGKAGFVKVLEC